MPPVILLKSNVKCEQPSEDTHNDFETLVVVYCPHSNELNTTFYIDETKIPHQLKRAWHELKHNLADSIELYFMIKYLSEESNNAVQSSD